MRLLARHRAQDGFTLIEVAMASFLLVVGLLGAVTMIDFANRRTVDTKGREAATGLARQLIESSRAIPFETLNNTSIETGLQAQPGLATHPGSSIYTIKRRGFTYSIDATTCSLDDPRDGIGPHAGGDFCKGGTGIDDGPDCAGAVSAKAAAGVDSNGNQLSAGVHCAVDQTLVWQVCNALNTTASASGSFSAILGSLYTEAQAAAAATLCNGGTAVAADTNPEDYKRVTVNVRWRGNRTQQSTFIPNPGTAAGPSVVNLVTTSNGGNLTVTSNLTSLDFTATTNRPPATVNWTRDGEAQGTASGSGTSWNFTWAINDMNAAGRVYDGTYIVGARAQDTNGLAGAGRTVNVTLNRRPPFAPANLVGGRNGSRVELEWAPNPERDIVGYRVYRVNSGGDVLVCGGGGGGLVATNCQDNAPPGLPVLNYYVKALDRDPAGALREGDASTQLVVTQGNNPPNPPRNLLAAKSSGTTILRWDPALIPDPDPTDTIAFYRIYRDGSAYADRYDRTGSGTNLTYTDTRPDGVQHTYWVTAVDSQYAESTLLGPVTK